MGLTMLDKKNADLMLFYAHDRRHSVLGQHAISWNTSVGDKMTEQTA